MKSVGIIIIAKETNRFLLLHRVKTPITWSSLAGKMEKSETDPLTTIKREIKEEIGINPMMIDDITEVGKIGDWHHVMVGYVDREFKIPNLDIKENDHYGWFSKDHLPTPIHPRWEETFQFIKPLLSLREELKKNFNKLMVESDEDEFEWAKEILAKKELPHFFIHTYFLVNPASEKIIIKLGGDIKFEENLVGFMIQDGVKSDGYSTNYTSTKETDTRFSENKWVDVTWVDHLLEIKYWVPISDEKAKEIINIIRNE